MECMGQTYPIDIQSDADFVEQALTLFHHQVRNNSVYQRYVECIDAAAARPKALEEIPFLPIELFRYHKVITGQWTPEIIFLSSGTSASTRSKHYMRSLEEYLLNAQRGFEEHYGPLRNYRILALLPSYFEVPASSLIAMVHHFIRQTEDPLSGFYHQKIPELIELLQRPHEKPCMLWSVSYALLDLIESLQGATIHPEIILLETGGMKGRREEIPKEAFHEILRHKLGVREVHSEYGMTELSSQAYAKDKGIFRPTSTFHVLVGDINDPFLIRKSGKGILHCVDLANTHSCAFIRTADVGEVFEDGSFRVIGRVDNALWRGCNLLYSRSWFG